MVLAASALAVSGCSDDGGNLESSATADSMGSPATVSASVAPSNPSAGGVSPAGSSTATSRKMSGSVQPTAATKVSELRAAADEVLALLAAKDYKGLAQRVHPSQGVRFTPYLTVDVEGDVRLTPGQVAELADNDELFIWGAEPGSGEVIKTTFSEYAKRFITNLDYAAAPVVAENERTASGSSLDNVTEAYPNAQFVEYNFPGFDPQYGGLDWQSQRLVFTKQDGQLYLVGIVHDSWTP